MPANARTGEAAGNPARRLARRLLQALVLSLVVLVTAALPASAHAVGGAAPTNYQTRILSVSPQVPGVTVRVVEAGARIELVNTSGQDVVVPGYGGEPYLKVGPGGVEENTRSPATYLNQTIDASTKPPGDADVKAAPAWREVNDGNTVAWHDHRTHWMGADPPPDVRQNPHQQHVIIPEWKIDLQRAGQPIVVTGDLTWVPGPSAVPWLIGAAVLAVLIVLASRTPAWAGVITGALILLVVIDIVHTIGVWSGTATSVPVKLYSSVVPVAGWLVAVVAVLRMRAGQRESGVFFALFAAALALVSALGDLSALSSSQLVGGFPEWVTRLAVAARVGLAAGIAVAGLIAMRKTAMPNRPEPSTGHAAAGLLAVAVLAGGLLLAGARPAEAHGDQVLIKAAAARVPARPNAVRVTATATYLDGDRAGGLALRAVASDAGRHVAFPLRAAGGRGSYAATAVLGPGAWTIKVAPSGKVKGQATVRITVPKPAAPTAGPTTTTAGPTTTTAAPTTEPAATPATAGDLDAGVGVAAGDGVTFATEPAAAQRGGGARTAAIVAALAIGGLAALAAGGVLMLRNRQQ
jgi:hypothetical protein